MRHRFARIISFSKLQSPIPFQKTPQAHAENQKSAEVLWVNRVYGGAEEFCEDNKLRERQDGAQQIRARQQQALKEKLLLSAARIERAADLRAERDAKRKIANRLALEEKERRAEENRQAQMMAVKTRAAKVGKSASTNDGGEDEGGEGRNGFECL